MRRLILLLAVVAACGDNLKPQVTPDDAGIDAAVDGGTGRLTGCLDRPGQPPAAPNGQLPCDLVPPGQSL